MLDHNFFFKRNDASFTASNETSGEHTRSRLGVARNVAKGRTKRGVGWLLMGIVVAQTGFVQAETRYATDAIPVPLHKGPSTRFKIARMVPGGTPLEALESNDKEGYTKVRTTDGTVGWILTRYLMDQPVPRERVTQLEARIAGFENETRALREDAKALGATRENLNRCSQELTAVRRSAAQTLEIEEENNRLQEEITAANDQRRQFELENESLQKQSSRNWFLAGAGVGFGGLLLGLILPRLSWQRRRRWDQF